MGLGVLGGEEGLEGTNHKKKLKERSQKSEKFWKNHLIFFFSIGTALEPTLNPFKTKNRSENIKNWQNCEKIGG